jgi:hypothetical protein
MSGPDAEPKRPKRPRGGFGQYDRAKIPFRFTPVPLSFVSAWLPHLEGSEVAVYLYTTQRTVGYRKEWDAISHEQFAHGIVDRNGRRIDNGTGLSLSGVRRAIARLIERGLLDVRRSTNRPNEYRIAMGLPVTTVTPCQEGEGATTVTP